MTSKMFSSPFSASKSALRWSAVFWMSLLSVLGVAHAQNGSFIIPEIRAGGGTDFAYWDLFSRPPGSNSSVNYNYANPPALIEGVDSDGNPTTVLEDDDDNPGTPPVPRTTLIQNGAPDAFVTSSSAIYSFSDIVRFEVPYEPSEESPGEVTNVIFQTQTGGSRLNVNTVELVYEQAGVAVSVMPVFRGMDDPQTGDFSERIVCAFQWNLTGLNVRNFKIVFSAPDASMPLWQAQLDVVAGAPFVQELGYLLATRSRPVTRFEKAGAVDKNLPLSADGRFFMEGEELNLLGDPETGWRMSGWYYNGETQTGLNLPLVFPAQDITVTALFAPNSYSAWRVSMFNHASIISPDNDYLDDAISAPSVDHDEDGLTNAGEYAFGGDPYTQDDERTRPQLMMVQVEGVNHPALRYRTSGLPPGTGDVVHKVRVAANGGAWQDNSGTPTTVTFERRLQPDGSELVTERTLQPMSSFASVEMDVAWSVGGADGIPQAPAPLAITTESPLAAARVGTSFSTQIAATGGMSPYTWSRTAGSLPPGMTLEADGTLAGLPTTAGSYSFTAQVTDAVLIDVTRVFNITVEPFEITTGASLAARPIGFPVNVPLAAAGGTGPYIWTVAAGTLPDGVTLSEEGVLSGTPEVVGDYGFTLEVEDTNSFTASRVFTWNLFEIQIVTANPLPTGVPTFPYQHTLQVSGGASPHTWTVTAGALPENIDLSTGGVLSGTPSETGLSSFTVEVTDADGFTAVKDFDLPVSATAPAPVMNPVVFAATTPGADFSHTVTATNYPDKFTITGLPKGLKYVANTGVISGKTTLPGVYLVQVKASNAGGTSAMVTAPLIVKALAPAIVGSFTGLVDRDASANGGLGSVFTLTTTSTGAFTLQVKSAATTSSVKGFLAGSAPQVSVNVGSSLLSLTLDPVTNLVTGTHGAADINGWRMVWDKKFNPAASREGYYSVALDLADEEDLEDDIIPHGVGYANFSVLSAGTLKITGKTADGQTLTAATTLGPDGQIAVYTPLYAKKGSVMGQWEIAEDAEGLFMENDVSGEMSWQKPLTKGRAYAAAFGPTDLAVEGGYLGYSARGPVALGLPDTGEISVTFAGGGVEASAVNPDVTGAKWTEAYAVNMTGAVNAGAVTLKVNKATGAVTGAFTLQETTPPLLRKGVKFQGQVVRLSDGTVKAAGYFLLPQIPVGDQKATATPVLSGSFILSQEVSP